MTEVVLAVSYKPEVMLGALADMEVKYGVKLTCSQEVEPMGTGMYLHFHGMLHVRVVVRGARAAIPLPLRMYLDGAPSAQP